MDTKGVIYILTNPSFPDYVKIGYANNIQKRLAELNRSECIPFAFRIYATYEVPKRLTDLSLHALIDKLNPTLRAIDTFKGKPRKKEFYAMTKEDAYSLLEAIAEIHLQRNKIMMLTLKPNKDYSIGNNVPENFLWTLNYRSYIESINNIEEAQSIILDSYNQRK